MPYSGFVTLEITSAGIPSDNIQECIFLGVPETDYNKTVPLLIGTNILDESLLYCKSNIIENFLQKSALHTSWYLAFRDIVIRERELRRKKNRSALIRSAEQKQITIPPNSSITIKGITAKEIDHQETCAMIVGTEDSALPSDFDVTAAVITYNFGKTGLIDVQITNVTTSTFNIPPRETICELQPVP